MDWKIESLAVPITDVDRAKAFYVDQVGFHADHDVRVNDELRFVQLTPPGSACSIAIGEGLTDMAPGSQKGIQIVIADAAAAHAQLIAKGVAASDIDDQPWVVSSTSAILTGTPGPCSNCHPAHSCAGAGHS